MQLLPIHKTTIVGLIACTSVYASLTCQASEWEHSVAFKNASSFDGKKNLAVSNLTFEKWPKKVSLGQTVTIDEKISRSPLLFDGIPVLGADVVWEGTLENPTWFAQDVPSALTKGFIVTSARTWGAESLGSLFGEKKIKNWNRVYLTNDEMLEPFIYVTFIQNQKDKPIVALVHSNTASVRYFYAADLQLSGTLLAYDENKVRSSGIGMKEQPVEGLVSGSYLWADVFRIHSCHDLDVSYSRCTASVFGKNGKFEVSDASTFYDEVVAFYSISKAVAWHRQIMDDDVKAKYNNFGLKSPLDVFVRAYFANTFDTAIYRFDGLSPLQTPVIIIGSGFEPIQSRKESRLKSLGKDSDVYFHEFSHHILHRSLNLPPSTMSLQTRALHEGFADYFAYAISGNPNLAESVVAGNGEQQLRTAENKTDFDQLVASGPYEWGEAWSGALWTLRAQLGPYQGDTSREGFAMADKIAWDSVGYLTPSAGIFQAACAFLKQSNTIFNSAKLPKDKTAEFTTLILNEFVARRIFANAEIQSNGCPTGGDTVIQVGLDPEKVDQLEPLSNPSELSVTFDPQGIPTPVPPRSGSLYRPVQSSWCGVLGNKVESKEKTLFTASLLFLPLFLVTRSKFLLCLTASSLRVLYRKLQRCIVFFKWFTRVL